MDIGTRSIGAIARESGLSVSALRFYDAAGVLRPARVDPVSGYRWYSADQVGQARLIAVLRRVKAIEAGGADQLVLALDGPITPLAIRDPDRPEDISLLMPTRLT